MKMDSQRFVYRILEKLAGLRTSLMSEPLGDRVILIRSDIFKISDGYPEVFIMKVSVS